MVSIVTTIRPDANTDTWSFKMDLRHRRRGHHERPRCNDANRKFSHLRILLGVDERSTQVHRDCFWNIQLNRQELLEVPPFSTEQNRPALEGQMGRGLLLWLIGIHPLLLNAAKADELRRR
jgi:hypothetical protein